MIFRSLRVTNAAAAILLSFCGGTTGQDTSNMAQLVSTLRAIGRFSTAIPDFDR
jgi:hypothetical protein